LKILPIKQFNGIFQTAFTFEGSWDEPSRFKKCTAQKFVDQRRITSKQETMAMFLHVPLGHVAQCLEKRKFRKMFTPEEDKRLIELVEKYGTNSWWVVSSKMSARSSRQCRERWTTYLAPDVDKSPWNQQEDRLLIEKVRELGSQWSLIKVYFVNRTVNNSKNRWNTVLRRMRANNLDVNNTDAFVLCGRSVKTIKERDQSDSSETSESPDATSVFNVQNLLN
jgi:hypothetical protein